MAAHIVAAHADTDTFLYRFAATVGGACRGNNGVQIHGAARSVRI